MPVESPRQPATPDSAADRNLLFGILALQNNFINREALLAAFTGWIADKGRPLGEILCEQGKLSPSQNELLHALTEEHVRQHGRDPEQSLAAVSTVGSLHDALRMLGDPLLEASLANVARQPGSADSDATTAAATTDWRAEGLRFRVLRPHAKGGLGEVFVAQDVELRREVALKEIQARFADQPHSRARFVQEAEITGGLEHPGIVPVYGLGQYADGQPFYAMRFIRGDSLKEAIELFHKPAAAGRAPGERTLELRKLLGRFIDVCEAMEYAHSRGVLHRDLKPGNIMLGKYGETLVVDWGLAKPVGRGERTSASDEATLHPMSGDSVEPTLLGAAVGTPGYMSPEQAAGRLGELGPASDVYSLGATLYCLLTGQAPFSGDDQGEILRRVQRGEFPPPREVKPQVPPALQAICLRAMELKPTDRYPSPRALADDIEHWLADEPVSCLAESFIVRTRRWTKGHPALVVGTAATVLISLVSLAAIAAIVGQSNTTLSRKNQELQAANQREREASELAQMNERTAAENAEVAREQSHLALRSLQSVIFEIQAKLKNVAGTGDLQRVLLKTALVRLQDVSDQFAARSAIDRTTLVALSDIGGVFLRMGSGTPGGSDADGPLAAARKVYEQAFVIAEKLAALDPSEGQAQRDLSMAYSNLGDVSLQTGQVTATLGHYQKALEICLKLAAADPTGVQAQRDLSVSHGKLGDASLRSGQVPEALGHYRTSLEVRLKLAALDSTNLEAQRELWLSHEDLGEVSLQTGQLAEALGHFQRGLEISQKLAAADPTDAQAQRDLSVSHEKLGDMSLSAEQLPEALGHYQKDLEICQTLAAADPAAVQAQRDLSIAFTKLGDVSLRAGQVAEALSHYQKDLEISQKLAALDPTDGQAQRDLSVTYSRLGEVSVQAGQLTEALGHYQNALEICQALAAADPTNAQTQIDLVINFQKLGSWQENQKEYRQALESYGHGMKVLLALQEQKRLPPANEDWIPSLRQVIQQCELAAAAMSEWQVLLKQPSELLPVLLEMRATQFVQEGRAIDAIQAVAKLRELGTATPDQLYNAACVYSLCATGINATQGDATTALTPEKATERQQYLTDALATLREAIQAGWKDFAHMRQDPDLSVLRDLPEFKVLLPGSDSKEP